MTVGCLLNLEKDGVSNSVAAAVDNRRLDGLLLGRDMAISCPVPFERPCRNLCLGTSGCLFRMIIRWAPLGLSFSSYVLGGDTLRCLAERGVRKVIIRTALNEFKQEFRSLVFVGVMLAVWIAVSSRLLLPIIGDF